MSYPWRKVTKAQRHAGRGSFLGGDTSRRSRWWDLTLECGHHEERTCRYKPLAGGRDGTRHRSADDILPAPARARCHQCLRSW